MGSDHELGETTPNSVHQFPAAPRRVQVAGRSYALSDIGVPMLEMFEPAERDDDLGARLVDVGGEPARYLWVATPDGQVMMWRYSDGDEKLAGFVTDFPETVQKLRSMRQLNEVTVEEMEVVHAAMLDRYEETVDRLRALVAATNSDQQNAVNRLVVQYLDDEVMPIAREMWSAIDAGAIPLGFKPQDIPIPVDRQARTWAFYVACGVANFDHASPELEQYVLRGLGLLDSSQLEDVQAIYWAYHDALAARQGMHL